MKKQKRVYAFTLLAGALVAFGIVFITISYISPLNTAQTANLGSQIARDVGIALVIAGFLGASVDQLLRRQLAEDAFKASVGYLLPDELRGEMEWIYNTHILCVEHTQECGLHPIDDETCIAHSKMLRKFRNVSSSNESLSLGVAVDEWFHKQGSSKILSFGYTKLGVKTENLDVIKSNCAINVKEQKVTLVVGEEITVWFDVEEVKRTNDELIWVFAYPTLNPTVTVKAFDGLSINAGFGYRSAAEELGIGRYRLKGTLLPSQSIVIRWWDKSKSEQWKQEK